MFSLAVPDLFCVLLILNLFTICFSDCYSCSSLSEDLDKTLEAPGERMSPKGDTDPEPEVQGSF